MIVALVCVLAFACAASGKTYERCELARELKYVHGAPESQVATWVCIARHESEYNTSAVGCRNGDGSSDHGIFQISDKYWCSPPGKGWACGLPCAALEDEDIADDFACANKIYREHKYLQGDGFKAWTVYEFHCTGSHVQEYVEGCFTADDLATTHPKKKPTTKKVYPWQVTRPSPTQVDSTPSTCSNRVDTPDGVSTHFPTAATASRFDSIPPTTTQLVAVTPASLRPGITFSTSNNRFEIRTESKLAFSLSDDSEPRSNRKRQSVFIINGRVWP